MLGRCWNECANARDYLCLACRLANLVGCESSRTQDYQFEKQVKRAQECRQLQDKLVGLTPERSEEITKTMAGAGCTARLPSTDLHERMALSA
jgi:hypothetical protein